MQYGQHTFLYTADEGRSLEGVVEYIRAAEWLFLQAGDTDSRLCIGGVLLQAAAAASGVKEQQQSDLQLVVRPSLARRLHSGSVNTQPAAARWINMAAFLNALMSNVIVTHLCDPVMSSDTLSHFLNLAYTVCQGCHTPGSPGYQLS